MSLALRALQKVAWYPDVPMGVANLLTTKVSKPSMKPLSFKPPTVAPGAAERALKQTSGVLSKHLMPPGPKKKGIADLLAAIRASKAS